MMEKVSQVLISIGALVLGALGLVHLIITFFGNRMHPRNRELIVLMQNSHPVITKQTTMWRGWLGFNASHSLGAMLFGAVFGYLSIYQPGVLFGSPFLLAVGLIMLLGFLVLAKLYWFSVPLLGIGISFIFYVTGAVMGAVL